MTGATSAPATAADAQALYTDSLGALSSFIGSNVGATNSRLSRANARKTTSDTKSLTENIPSSNGGSVDLVGSYTETSTFPDDTETFQPNHTYSWNYSMDGNVTGTMNSVKVKKGIHTYTICGTLKETQASNVNFDYKTGATQDATGSGTLSFSFGIGLGTAVSVVREDGLGAKFVISYAANYGKDDISLSEDSNEMVAAEKELEDYLKQQTATLTVYDRTTTRYPKAIFPPMKSLTAHRFFKT